MNKIITFGAVAWLLFTVLYFSDFFAHPKVIAVALEWSGGAIALSLFVAILCRGYRSEAD